MDLQVLIFDFDGTLADTIPLCVAAMQHALQKNTGRAYTPEEIVAEFGITEEGILRKLAPETHAACLQDFLQYYREHHENHSWFDGMEALLTAAQDRGLKLALVTGKGPGSAAISARALGLSRFFPIVRTGSDERDVKADHIRRICAELGAPPSAAAYIGDAPSDMVAAREAGATALGVLWSNTVPEERLREVASDKIFASVKEFGDWLARSAASR